MAAEGDREEKGELELSRRRGLDLQGENGCGDGATEWIYLMLLYT